MVGGDGIAKAIEPGPRIEVESAERQLLQHRLVSVSHDEEPDLRLVG
jgi:hypothetical protein